MAQTRIIAAVGAAALGGALLYSNRPSQPSTISAGSGSSVTPTKSSNTPSDTRGSKADALPVHPASSGESSAKDARGSSDSASGSASAKAKMEAGVGATRSGKDASGRQGGERAGAAGSA